MGAFYVLTAGRLKVTQVTPRKGSRSWCASSVRAKMFGCVAVFGGHRYPGTATAVEDCRMIGFTKGAMQHLMERHPRLAINTMGTIGGLL